jgi:hypothetical protein
MSEGVNKAVQIPRKRGHPKASVIRQCTVVGCAGRAYKNNPYCQKCTRRFERTGDPTRTRTRGRKPNA